MKFLIDTHILVWWLGDDAKLGYRARRLIADGEPILSVVSLWELAIKASLGKIHVEVDRVVGQINDQMFGRLPIRDSHIESLSRLPWHHKDPFDRLLVAQALVESLPLMTNDRKMARYDGPRVDIG